MGSAWRPRIGLVTVRSTLFDAQMEPGFPVACPPHAARSRAVRETFADGIAPNRIQPKADAVAAGAILADALGIEHVRV